MQLIRSRYEVTMNGVWTGNRIHCTLNTQLVSKLYKTLSHTDKRSQSLTIFISRCLVAVFNGTGDVAIKTDLKQFQLLYLQHDLSQRYYLRV
jgi:hypothetical protein